MYQVSKGPVGCTVTTYGRRGLVLRGVGEPELHQLSPQPSWVSGFGGGGAPDVMNFRGPPNSLRNKGKRARSQAELRVGS